MPDSIGRKVQSAIYRAGASGAEPIVPVAWPALESAAERAMSRKAWAYVAGSAGLERTAAANHAAFARYGIVPRVLRDVEQRDLSVELFGHRYPTPLIAAPVGVLSLVHRDADLAVARACAAVGVPFVFSNQASVPMEAVASGMNGASHWFQLYWSSSDDLVASLVRRAEISGAQAIVVTLDTHVLGWRPRDLDLAYLPFAHGQGIAQYTSDPVFLELVRSRLSTPLQKARVTPAAIRTLVDMTRAYPGPAREARVAVDTFLDVFSRSSLTWQNLAFLRQHTSLPIVLKGIQHPDDARLAVEYGMDAVQVSNHAGRQLDGAIGSLDALPGVVEAVAGRVPVIFDSGVRTGSDILVALALGATAVAVGRPYVFGLAAGGQDGVEAVLRNLVAEFDLSLALAGHSSPSSLSPNALAEHIPARDS